MNAEPVRLIAAPSQECAPATGAKAAASKFLLTYPDA